MSPAGAGWRGVSERGTLFGIRLVFRLAALFGRAPLRPLVAAIALWYRLFDRAAVAASRDWLTRVHGRPPRRGEIFRHIRVFAQVTLDRVFLAQGRTRGLALTRTGNEHLERQMATGKGAILLGAHLGSFEAMRLGGATTGVPIQILGDFRNARMINSLLESLDAGLAARVIHLGADPVATMTRVQRCVERGEFVALLGDRVGPDERAVRTRFFGDEAAFAAGPFLLASLLRCPVYLVFGLYRAPNRYDLHCEPFATAIQLPRGEREQALAAWVARYAERLETYCRAAPDNWFNWFDFWRPAPPRAAASRAVAAARNLAEP